MVRSEEAHKQQSYENIERKTQKLDLSRPG